MKLIKYHYTDASFQMEEIELKNLNLIVGVSGSGKTRLLNTIFNLFRASLSSEIKKAGSWDITFEVNGKLFEWKLKLILNENQIVNVESEFLKDLSSNNVLVERTKSLFEFNGQKLPQLKLTETSISLYRDDPIIKPIYLAFTSVLIRNFSHDYIGDNYLGQMPLIENEVKIMKGGRKNFNQLLHMETSLNILLYALKEYDKEHFKLFEDFFLNLFPNFEKIDIKDISYFNPNIPMLKTPIFCVREKNVAEWIKFNRLSSGIQKTIIIMVDILIIGKDWIYLIDEYENSLGPLIIDFFYDWTQQLDFSNQYIMTSHHPYVINNIPIENWLVCSRKGSNIDFIYGEKLTNIIGKSNQTSFTKLLNTPLFDRDFR